MQIEKKAWNQGRSCCLQERQKQKEHEIGEAVKWCKENNKRGQATFKTGIVPLKVVFKVLVQQDSWKNILNAFYFKGLPWLQNYFLP